MSKDTPAPILSEEEFAQLLHECITTRLVAERADWLVDALTRHDRAQRQLIEELTKENEEQARLHGLGSEREARQLATIEELRRENAELNKRLDARRSNACWDDEL